MKLKNLKSLVDDMDYLCLISTDGKMQLTIPATDEMQPYDAVTVQIGDDEQAGLSFLGRPIQISAGPCVDIRRREMPHVDRSRPDLERVVPALAAAKTKIRVKACPTGSATLRAAGM